MIDDVSNDLLIHGFAVRCDSSNCDSMDTDKLEGLHGNGMVNQPESESNIKGQAASGTSS